MVTVNVLVNFALNVTANISGVFTVTITSIVTVNVVVNFALNGTANISDVFTVIVTVNVVVNFALNGTANISVVFTIIVTLIPSDTTGNRSRDRPTSSAVPQPLRHPRPYLMTNIIRISTPSLVGVLFM